MLVGIALPVALPVACYRLLCLGAGVGKGLQLILSETQRSQNGVWQIEMGNTNEYCKSYFCSLIK